MQIWHYSVTFHSCEKITKMSTNCCNISSQTEQAANIKFVMANLWSEIHKFSSRQQEAVWGVVFSTLCSVYGIWAGFGPGNGSAQSTSSFWSIYSCSFSFCEPLCCMAQSLPQLVVFFYGNAVRAISPLLDSCRVGQTRGKKVSAVSVLIWGERLEQDCSTSMWDCFLSKLLQKHLSGLRGSEPCLPIMSAYRFTISNRRWQQLLKDNN